MKFEFAIRHALPETLHSVLNDWGEAGWEPIKISDLNEYTQRVEIIFKREKR